MSKHIIKYKLEVTQTYQETDYYCVSATVQMALSYHNINLSQTRFAAELNTSPQTGTEYVDLARVLNHYLFHTDYVEPNQPGYHVQTFKPGHMNTNDLDKLRTRITTNIEHQDFTFIAINSQTL